MPFSINSDNLGIVRDTQNSNKRILVSGKAQERKNILQVLNILHEVSLQSSIDFETTLTLIVRNNSEDFDYLKKIEEFIYRHFKKVDLKINVPLMKMGSIYSISDCFILVSDREPAAFSNIEATSYGCYTIISKENGSESQHPYNSKITSRSSISDLYTSIYNYLLMNQSHEMADFQIAFNKMFSSDAIASSFILKLRSLMTK